MRNLLSLLRSNRIFLLPYAAILLVSAYFLARFTKDEIHMSMNAHYSAIGDLVMPWITYMGDGLVVTVLVLLLFAINRNYAFFTGISCLVASGITQLLKHTYYYGVPRPAYEFPGKLHLIHGLKNYLYDTFPSGHSTLAFAFFFSLAIGAEKNWVKMLFLFCAFLVAWSRIYLSQHFLEDTFAGSIIGTITALVVFAFALHYEKVKLPALKFSR
ncbi:MAG TPA: phosphatase PAP2 family protein [Bacteroidia bacterium]|jgi:membrane-associated phospholipid phosphatase|nr:phosphatase PAP2 family protein [Bacteroidia bacterium]